jgi:hypothetical protein
MMMVMELPSTKKRFGMVWIFKKMRIRSSKFIWDASDVQIAEPIVPPCEDWVRWKISKRKKVVGIYISGHPLDDYKFEMKYFVTRS